MCGRFDRHRELAHFNTAMGEVDCSGGAVLPANYNVAPSQPAWVVHGSSGNAAVSVMSWGFVPEWVSETRFTRPINARSETAHEKPMFRAAFSKQRCLVLCDGYYEWQRLSKGRKQPHYFSLPLDAPMILAGLYSSNERLTGNVLDTFCVLTVSASSAVKSVHHRMPVILDQEGQSAWLDPERREEVALRPWLRPWAGEIEISPVSTFVNSPANNSAQCIQPLQTDSAPV